SLNDSLILRGLPGKSDLIKTEYWDKGIDTMLVPEPLLREYNQGDCVGTWNLYLKQRELLRPEQRSLFQLHCDDLLVLQEMEMNGMMFDVEEAKIKQQEAEINYNNIISQLRVLVPHSFINWNSNDHLSAVLYGGPVSYRAREVVQKTYKKGVKDVERWGTQTVQLPRLV